MRHCEDERPTGGQAVIGEYVIVNHAERPCSRLVAKVVDEDATCYVCVYENKKLRRQWKKMRNEKCMVTPVSHFGHDFIDGLAVKNDALPHLAKYEDGKPRYWQPEPIEIQAQKATECLV